MATLSTVAAWQLALILPLAVDPPLPPLETVRAAYTATATAIHSLEVETTIGAFRPQGKLDFGYKFLRFKLWRQGDLRAVRMEMFREQSELSSTWWGGFDGKIYAEYRQDPRPLAETDNLPHGQIRLDRLNLLYDHPVPDLFTGEQLVSGTLSLEQMLETASPQLSWDQVNGQRCVKVQMAPHIQHRFASQNLCVETTAWFDPQCGYLPRRILSQNYVEGRHKPPRVLELLVTDIRRLPGADGNTYWLPWSGEKRNWGGATAVTLASARINGPIAREVFQPSFPELTRIADFRRGSSPIITINGDAQRREHLSKLIEQRQKLQPAPGK